MSAIATPFISSTTANNPNTLVPVEQITGMDKLNVVNAPNSQPDSFRIIFAVTPPGSVPREITLFYSVEATRDAAFTAIKAVINTPV